MLHIHEEIFFAETKKKVDYLLQKRWYDHTLEWMKECLVTYLFFYLAFPQNGN